MKDIDKMVEAIKNLTAEKTARLPVSDSQQRPLSKHPNPLEKSPSGSTRLAPQTELHSTYHCAGAAAEEVKRVEVVSEEDLVKLLQHFIRKPFLLQDDDEFSMDVQKKCEALFRKDYKCSFIRNSSGLLSPSYPYRLTYIEKELKPDERDGLDVLEGEEMSEKARKVQEKSEESAHGRHEKRFPVSVMMYNGKHICRSANPASEKEIHNRYLKASRSADSDAASASPGRRAKVKSPQSPTKKRDSVKMACDADIALLKAYKVSYILDFEMNQKISPYMSRPESAKSSWYKEEKFMILQVPYPDSSFFKKYSKLGTGCNLACKWTQEERALYIPKARHFEVPGVRWNKYKEWDLDDLTKNYLKLLLSIVSKGEAGILIECPDGIDRTPLFVSLLRISLWADGKIHKSLLPIEIAYLVVAYDWYLFGHKLPERIREGSEVLTFCFHALSLIVTPECCMHTCINTFFNPSMKADLPIETGTLPESESSTAGIASLHKDMDEVEEKTPNPKAPFDVLFVEAYERQFNKTDTEKVIPETLPKEIPMERRSDPESALMSSLKGIDVDTILTATYMRNTTEKCRSYSNIYDAKPMNVLTWRRKKLQTTRALYISHFSIAVSRSLVEEHDMENKTFVAGCISLKSVDQSFMKALANLTVSKFTWEDLCPRYEKEEVAEVETPQDFV